ncbi:MAG: hypothetical protein GVY10_06180 [Verrucomicrobia bacterium]|jgi:tetratricopeptide (TPR) repeat protein|nr:hypothetical protein [Verrucomicrobiota bacterium]
MEAQNWEEAARIARAAHYLVPEDPEPQILVAQALLQQRSGDALRWWEGILREPQVPVEGLRELTGLLLQGRRLEEALPFLERLVELDRDNEETKLLWLRALSMQRRLDSAFGLASDLVMAGSDSWQAHEQYLEMQRLVNARDGEPVSSHLERLMQRGGDLGLRAARELASEEAAPEEKRLQAAAYLKERGEGLLDRLYGTGLEVRIGVAERKKLNPLMDELLISPSKEQVEEFLRWSLWMEQPGLALDRIGWPRYRELEGAAEPYFRALLEAGRYRELLKRAETARAMEQREQSLILVYRAAALESLERLEEAQETLRLAVQVVEPGQTRTLERHLLRDQRWELLMELYKWLLEQDPDNPVFLQKNLAAHYYLGRQDWLEARIGEVEVDDFDDFAGLQSFVIYLKLILEGPTPELHRNVEERLAEFPEISDYQLLAGLSYLLQEQVNVAAEFLEQTPDLRLSAPRHLRMGAILMGGGDADSLLRPGERGQLLPRERYLLSQFPEPPTR